MEYVPVIKDLFQYILGPSGAFILLIIIFALFIAGVVFTARYIKSIVDRLISEFLETNTQLFRVNERLSTTHKQEMERLMTLQKEEITRCESRYESMRQELSSALRELFRKG